MNKTSFEKITLVSVTGLADASGAAMALAHSKAQMPGAQAVLCCPQAPADLDAGIAHIAIAPMNYHEYSWFIMFALWRVIPTEFALIVQEDGWVVNANNWTDDFLNYDYIGAPIHLARIDGPQGWYWQRNFRWDEEMGKPDHTVTPVMNGGFSLRSQRMMRALLDHPEIRVEVPRPVIHEGAALQMLWLHDELNEDVQLSGILRPALEAAGLRFAPTALARCFAIEHAGPQIHHGFEATQIFGHHSKNRRLTGLSPLTVRMPYQPSQVEQLYGESAILEMFARNGYRLEFDAEQPAQ